MVKFFPRFYITLGSLGNSSVYIKDSSGDWQEFINYEFFKVMKRLNQVSEFELRLYDIQGAEKAYVKEFAEVLFFSENNLILKGRIQKINYETSFSAIATGYGMEAKLLDKELVENDNTSATWEELKRGQWTNISAQTVAKEILSSNTDGVTPWVMTPNNTGLFDTDYGDISVRYEYANRLNALAKTAEAIDYEWWVTQGNNYSDDFFNIAPLQPDGTQAIVSQETFAITGASANCYLTNKETDINSVANKVDALGRGDGVNQIRTSCYNASTTTSTLSADITDSATTIGLTDASSFDATGTIRIMEEIITYSGKSGNNLTGCTRGTSSTTAFSHKKNVFVEKHLAIGSAEAGSSIKDNGLLDITEPRRDIIDRDTLELIASRILIDRKDPIIRIMIQPNEPLAVAGAREIGELITITDAESDISDDYRIVSITYTSDYGILGMQIEASNKSLTFIEQMQKQRENNENLSKYMQGATNIDTTSILDNLEAEGSPTANPAPGAMDVYFHIPEDAVAINLVKLSYRLQAPKTWGSNTSAGSAHSHTLSIGASGAHTHFVSDTSSNESSHDHVGSISGDGSSNPVVHVPDTDSGNFKGDASATFNSYDVRESTESHNHTISDTSTSTTHTHPGLATNSESAHTHSVTYDLAAQTYGASDIRIYTSDDASGTPTWTERTAAIEAIEGTLANTENSTESNIDVTSFFSGTGWKGIRIVANGDARCYASVMTKVFVESTTK
jgi:hypothetical protein